MSKWDKAQLCILYQCNACQVSSAKFTCGSKIVHKVIRGIFKSCRIQLEFFRTNFAMDQLTVTLAKTRTATGDAATPSRSRTTEMNTFSCDTSTATRKKEQKTTTPTIMARFSRRMAMDAGCFPKMIRKFLAGSRSQAARQISSTARDPSSATKFTQTGRAGVHATPTATTDTEVEKEAATMPRHVRMILRSNTSLVHQPSARKWRQHRVRRLRRVRHRLKKKQIQMILISFQVIQQDRVRSDLRW